MRNNPAVLVAPATVRGRATGRPIDARSRLLEGDEARHAARAIARRQPILQGVLVPVTHKPMRYRTLHYELTLPWRDDLRRLRHRRLRLRRPAADRLGAHRDRADGGPGGRRARARREPAAVGVQRRIVEDAALGRP